MTQAKKVAKPKSVKTIPATGSTKHNRELIIGVIVMIVITLGIVASLVLMQSSADSRSSAKERVNEGGYTRETRRKQLERKRDDIIDKLRRDNNRGR